MDEAPPSAAGPVALRAVAVWLAGALDGARCYTAAAYAAMAADAIVVEGAEERDMRTDVELDFELDEHGRVWMIRDGDCHIIGRKAAVCATMRRFLAEAGA